MSTDTDLRDQAVTELKQTTVGYKNTHWTTPPAGSRWQKGLDLLAKIGVIAPPPPPPAVVHHVTVDATGLVSWTITEGADGYTLFDQTATPQYTPLGKVLSHRPAARPGETTAFDIQARKDGQPLGKWYSVEQGGRTDYTFPGTIPDPPPPTSNDFDFGLGVEVTPADVANAGKLGAKVVRLEYPIGTGAAGLDSLVNAYSNAGIRVQLLAGFHGRLPSTAECQNLATWAARFGPKSAAKTPVLEIEFGNETGYGYQYNDAWDHPSYAQRATNYGTLAEKACDALAGSGVGCLIQADDGGSGSDRWVRNMFAAAPGLKTKAAGLILHPYGPNGYAKVDRAVAFLAAAGAPTSLRFYMTEMGISTDDGRQLDDNYGYPKNMTYAAAAQALRDAMTLFHSKYGTRLAQVLLYKSTDDRPHGGSSGREDYFGALTVDGQPKGAFTDEVKAQIKA